MCGKLPVPPVSLTAERKIFPVCFCIIASSFLWAFPSPSTHCHRILSYVSNVIIIANEDWQQSAGMLPFLYNELPEIAD